MKQRGHKRVSPFSKTGEKGPSKLSPRSSLTGALKSTQKVSAQSTIYVTETNYSNVEMNKKNSKIQLQLILLSLVFHFFSFFKIFLFIYFTLFPFEIYGQ